MAAKTKTEASARQVLLPVLENGRIGYVNRDGKLVIPAQFQGLANGPGGLAAAISQCFCHEGLAPVQTAESWGYIDTTGKLAIDPQFEGAGSFHGGLAAVMLSG